MPWVRISVVALAGLVASACATPAVPEVGGRSAARQAGSTRSQVAAEEAAAAPRSPIEVRTEPEVVAAPEGALCVVRGTGRPETGKCGPAVLVSDARDGGRAIAQVAVGDFPIAWGFFADGTRAWVHAEASGVTVSGFSPHAGERFSIRGELEAVPERVWLFDETLVQVKRGSDDGGAVVSVQGDLDGIADMALNVSCEVLGYDTLARPTRGRVRPPRRGPIAVAKGTRLTLRTAPQDAPFVTLRGGGDSLPVSLEVREVLGDWTRVRLETRLVRLDGWVLEREIERNRLSGSVSRGRMSCGTGRGAEPALERVRLSEDAAIAVGPKGRVERAPALVIAKGTEVFVEERSDGRARVRMTGPITPPPGADFYLDESVLVAVAPAP